jgi:hypothetical protein
MTCRFLVHCGVVATEDVQAFLTEKKPARQRFIEITHPVVARAMDFRFVEDFKGLEIIPSAGTVIARDDGVEIATPYDNCVITQPSLRHLGPGVTVVRLGRIVEEPKL